MFSRQNRLERLPTVIERQAQYVSGEFCRTSARPRRSVCLSASVTGKCLRSPFGQTLLHYIHITGRCMSSFSLGPGKDIYITQRLSLPLSTQPSFRNVSGSATLIPTPKAVVILWPNIGLYPSNAILLQWDTLVLAALLLRCVPEHFFHGVSHRHSAGHGLRGCSLATQPPGWTAGLS